jgi:hypothetical protein
MHPRLRDHDRRRRRPEVLHEARQTRAHYQRHVPFHPPPQLPRRDDDLQQLRPDGVALAAGRGFGLDLGRTVRGQHDAQGGQHVALPQVGRVQETLVVAAALGPVGDLEVYDTVGAARGRLWVGNI